MLVSNCRVCNKPFEEPILKYENMPKFAQNFPDESTLHLDRGENLEVFQCPGCGLVQLNNEAVPYYKEVIRAAGISPEMTEFRSKQFKNFIDKYSLAKKKILEVGCGKGEYLSIMAKNNIDAYGIEYADESVSVCRENSLNVEKYYLENISDQLPHGPFDAFFILSFLEHMPHPNETLQALYYNLNEDGIGIVEVPNFDMIINNNLFSEFISDHLMYFTRKTLEKTLELNGFEVLEMTEVWYDYIISAVVKKRKKLNLGSFHNLKEKITKEAHEYIDQFEPKRVAIWGAGHQALALISLTDIYKKINYIVDSAPFKQNKFTPATHIPIVAPDQLLNNSVDTVIVMAASYSDEVAKIIQEKYTNIKNVSIFRDYGLEIIK